MRTTITLQNGMKIILTDDSSKDLVRMFDNAIRYKIPTQNKNHIVPSDIARNMFDYAVRKQDKLDYTSGANCLVGSNKIL